MDGNNIVIVISDIHWFRLSNGGEVLNFFSYKILFKKVLTNNKKLRSTIFAQ